MHKAFNLEKAYIVLHTFWFTNAVALPMPLNNMQVTETESKTAYPGGIKAVQPTGIDGKFYTQDLWCKV